MTATPTSGWRSGDKFTPIYGLVFLIPVIPFWIWWLLPDWEWAAIDFAMSALFELLFALILVMNLIRLRWRRVLSLVAAIGCIIGLYFGFEAVGITPDHLRFALTEKSYIRLIEQMPATSETPRLKTFEWDPTFVGNSYKTLVYDESDEIARPLGNQSAAWLKRSNDGCVGHEGCIPSMSQPPNELVTVHKLRDHFYIVDEYFPNAFP